MKKIVLLLVAIVMTLPILASCQNIPVATDDGRTPPILDHARELKIREDFLQFLIDTYGKNGSELNLEQVWVQRYYGNFRGCEMMYLRTPYLTQGMVISCMIIAAAGYHIIFPGFADYHAVSLYKDSKFYTLGEAYSNRLITKADVYNIGKQLDPSFTERYPKPPR
ncbi:MAG: hypothetical protein FWF18_04035 [Dehalococcoidia bacterium]|nr:hypothetical protein [Dehalococcoidia bacterium]